MLIYIRSHEAWNHPSGHAGEIYKLKLHCTRRWNVQAHSLSFPAASTLRKSRSRINLPRRKPGRHGGLELRWDV
jgi:hypothetical protein